MDLYAHWNMVIIWTIYFSNVLQFSFPKNKKAHKRERCIHKIAYLEILFSLIVMKHEYGFNGFKPESWLSIVMVFGFQWGI